MNVDSVKTYFSTFFDEFKTLKINKTVVIYAVCISMLFSLPLILSNHLYMDDFGRNIDGYGWDHDGRYLATILMRIFSVGEKITGIFPYSITLSCIIFFFSAYIITAKNSPFSIKTNLLISSTVFASPFILQNLSYRHDCILMALAVLVCTIPFIFAENTKKFAVCSIICLLFSALNYQPALTVYPLCALITCAFTLRNDLKKVGKIIITSFLSFLLSIIVYILIIKLVGADFYWQLGNSGPTSLFSSFEEIKHRLIAISFYIITSLNNIQNSIILIMLLISLLSAITHSGKSKINNIFTVILILLAFPLSISLSVLSKDTLILPRIFVGFFFLFILLLTLIDLKYEKIVIAISCVMIIIGFSTVSAYSSAIDEQYHFEESEILQAFSNVDTTNQDRIVVATGSLPYTDSVKLKAQNFPIIGKAVPVYMREKRYWGGRFLQNLGIIKDINQYKIPFNAKDLYNKTIASKCEMDLTKQSLYFNVYESDEAILLDFAKEPCETKNNLDDNQKTSLQKTKKR